MRGKRGRRPRGCVGRLLRDEQDRQAEGRPEPFLQREQLDDEIEDEEKPEPPPLDPPPPPHATTTVDATKSMLISSKFFIYILLFNT